MTCSADECLWVHAELKLAMNPMLSASALYGHGKAKSVAARHR